MHAAGVSHGADARLGQGKGRSPRRQHQIAGQRDLEAAAHGDALHRSDDGLVQIEAAGEPAVAGRRSRVGRAAFERGAHGTNVAARRKRPPAGTAHDRHPQRVIGGVGVEGRGHQGLGLRVEGVHRLRTVDGDGQHMAVDVGQNLAHGIGLLGGPREATPPRPAQRQAPLAAALCAASARSAGVSSLLSGPGWQPCAGPQPV